MKRINLLVAVAALFALPSLGSAQASQNVTATITIDETLAITLNSGTVSFPNPTSVDFDAGYRAASTSTTITHRGNVNYHLQVSTASATMGATTKASSDLEWQATSVAYGGPTPWTPLSTTATNVVPNVTAGSYSTDTTVNYRMRLSYATDAPGTYSVTFTYTLIAAP